MERRLGIMQSVEPVLENAIEILQKVVDIRGMVDEKPDEKPASAGQMSAAVDFVTDYGIAHLGIDKDIMTSSASAENVANALSKFMQYHSRLNKRDAAVAKTAAIKNIQKALTGRILKGDGDAAVAKTAAIKNVQKALTARILKGDDAEVVSSGCNVHYEINFNNGSSSAAAGVEERKQIQKALTARILKRFATGMNGDEDLGEDITMKGNKFHFRRSDGDNVFAFDASNVDINALKNLVIEKPSLIATMKNLSDSKLVNNLNKLETRGLGHAYIPATREDYDNAQALWKNNWAKYRAAHPHDQDCSISESDNWNGAQQCSQSWECRGARLCERGGWCSGYDGCEGTPLPDQAPGLAPDH